MSVNRSGPAASRFRIGVTAALLLQGLLLAYVAPTLWRHAGIALGDSGFDVSLGPGAPRISQLAPGGPATGLLEVDDEILALAGIEAPELQARQYGTLTPGASYELRLSRRGAAVVRSLVAPATGDLVSASRRS
jgi:hypothetical protein